MTPRVEIHAGGPRSGRARHMERLLAAHWGRARLIVPTRAAARLRLERAVHAHALPGGLGQPVVDFKSFAEELVRREDGPVRLASDLRRRLVLDAALARLRAEGRLTGLPESAHGPGLAAHLLEVITQLKQAAFEPHEFRARLAIAASPAPLDEAAAAAYEAYQHALIQEGLYDVPGLYWRAHDIAATGPPCALTGVDVLLIDGFDDFTPSEFRLITALAPHVTALAFGVALDLQSDRREAYNLAAQTFERLRSSFDAMVIEHEAPDPDSLVAHAADHIFWRSAPPKPGLLAGNLTIVPCIDAQHEAEEIARRARALVLEGAAPERIAIVFRNLRSAAPWLGPALAEHGLHARIEATVPLAATAPGAFLSGLLHAAAAWERESIAEVIASPLFSPGGVRNPRLQHAARVARRAMVLQGRVAWESRLAAYAAACESVVPAEAALARAIAAAVDHLASALAALPASGPVVAFCEGVEHLLLALGTEASLPAEAKEERQAYVALQALLAELPGNFPGVMTREEFVTLIDLALSEVPAPPRGPRHGIHCLDAANARHLDFDHVFFGGLNEGAVPQPAAANAIYNEAGRARLRGAGIALEGREERAAREMALFHHVLALPRAGLVLSYRLNEGGREAAPSPYLVQAMELFTADRPDVFAPPPLAGAFVPGLAAAASARGLRNAAFAQAAHGREAAFPELAQAAAIERGRYAAQEFGAHDGMVLSPKALAVLQARYGPDHVFSVAQIEAYAKCPFQFFALRILGAEEEDAPEADLGHLLRGSILHRVLQLFHQRFEGLHVAAIPAEDASRTALALLDEVFEERGWQARAAPEGVLHAERLRMEQTLLRYLAWAREKHGDWRPLHFEAAFGPAWDGSEERPAAVLETPAGPVRFSGRIDRIDEDAEGRLLRLIDYKSGGVPSAREITEGTSLQLALYALVSEQTLFPGKTCAEALYVRVGGAADRQALKTRDLGKGDITAHALGEVARCLGALRAGVFVPLPRAAACYGCTTAHICRHEKARIERKPVPAALGPDFSPNDDEEEE